MSLFLHHIKLLVILLVLMVFDVDTYPDRILFVLNLKLLN